MTRTFERMDKDKAWDKIVEHMWDSEEANWIEEGRPNDHIFLALASLNRFLFCLLKEKEKVLEMTRDELNKMTIAQLKLHLKQHGKRPNRQSMIKRHIIDLIIQEGFNRPPPKREFMGEGELNQLD